MDKQLLELSQIQFFHQIYVKEEIMMPLQHGNILIIIQLHQYHFK